MRTAVVCAALVGCGAPASADGAGAGGAASSSASTSPGDAGTEMAPCSTCRDAVLGDTPIAAAKSLCSEKSAPLYKAFVECGCADGGTCALACGPTLWCAGVYPEPKNWADPQGECAVCLGDFSPGCGAQQVECWND